MDNSMKEAINGIKKLLVFDTAVIVTLITVLIIVMIQYQKNEINNKNIGDTAGIEKTINETNMTSGENNESSSVEYYDSNTGDYTVKVKNSISTTGFKVDNTNDSKGSDILELSNVDSDEYTSIRFNMSGKWTRYDLDWYEIVDNGNNIKFKIKDHGTYSITEFYTSMSNVILEH